MVPTRVPLYPWRTHHHVSVQVLIRGRNRRNHRTWLRTARSDAAFTVIVNDGAGNSAKIDLAATPTNTTLTGSGASITSGSYFWNPSDGTVQGGVSASFQVVIGQYTINGQYALTNTPGTSTLAYLAMSNTNIVRSGNSGTAGDLTVQLSSDYTAPPPANGYNFGSTFSGQFGTTQPAGETATLTSSFAEGSTLFQYPSGTSTHVVVTSHPNHTNGAAEQWLSIPTGTTPFVLSQELEVNLVGGGSFNSGGVTSEITPAPAPSSIVLFASMLPFAGLLRLRRRLQKSEPVAAV